MNYGSPLRLLVAVGLTMIVVALNLPLTRVATAAPTTTSTASPSCPRTVSNGPLTLPPAPTGVIATDIYGAQQGTNPFPASIWEDASVSGVDLAIGWGDLEPDLAFAQQGT